MERCWHPDPTERPTASQIENYLRRYLANSKCNKKNIESAEFKRILRMSFGGNYKKEKENKNSSSSKCLSLKINSISLKRDSTMVDISELGLEEKFDNRRGCYGLYSAGYT
ncbi:22420_t:CDS:2, partial [Entrophospora sp. SA101]